MQKSHFYDVKYINVRFNNVASTVHHPTPFSPYGLRIYSYIALEYKCRGCWANYLLLSDKSSFVAGVATAAQPRSSSTHTLRASIASVYPQISTRSLVRIRRSRIRLTLKHTYFFELVVSVGCVCIFPSCARAENISAGTMRKIHTPSSSLDAVKK